MLSRRNVLATDAAGAMSAAAARAASFGNPDQPAEGAVNVTNPKALADPGPQDPDLAGNEPSFLSPPATDVKCRREHAPRARRRSRTALAPASGMGGHDVRRLPRDNSRPGRSS